MRNLFKSVVAMVLLPGLCFAQTPATRPPLVPANPPAQETTTAPTPPPPGDGTAVAPVQQDIGTPPPPGFQPPPNGVPPAYVPQGPSPYGTPYGQEQQRPRLEVGLMISESLFGMLTAAATTLLPYFLLLSPSGLGGGLTPPGGDPTLRNILTLIIFASTPLAVSQTQLSLANGSRYYQVESWPPALAGLVTQGIILGVFAATQGFSSDAAYTSGAVGLLVSSIVAVPLAEMAAINFFKYPKGGSGFFGGLSYSEKHGLQAGLPMPTPILSQTVLGPSVGVNFPVATGRF
ncbi:MAG: hypothetical protein ACT4TC_23595 [Myxococcaceae bacterium]